MRNLGPSAIAVCTLLAAPVAAQLQEAGADEPAVLTIYGALADGGEEVVLDYQDLETLPVVRFRTETIWTTGVKEFTGVPLAALLEAVEAEGRIVRLHALNDYRVDIPVEEITPEAPIVAYQMDGNVMPVRGKGPLWLVYPYDSAPEYQTEVVFARSIWQLNRIEVLP
jgi:hypothetical protein